VVKVEDIVYDPKVMSVPDEGYSRNASCAVHLISTLLFKTDRPGMIVILTLFYYTGELFYFFICFNF
jgi:hypothetical protein